VPVVTLGDAADAVHQYPTDVACREHSARLPRGRGALHRLVRDPRPDRTAGLLGDDRRLSAAEGRSYFAVNTLRPHQAVMIRYLHLCRDQARAPSPVKEKTALVLDRPRSALLTIPDALAGLRDGHCSSSASPRHCGRARSPGSKHAKLCATRNGVEPYRPGASSIRTCAARRSTAGRSHRSLPGQCTRRLARGHGDQPSAPACPAGGEG
jgi:hypothetical protein